MYGMNGRQAYLHRLGHLRRLNRATSTPVNTNHPLDVENTTEIDVENTTEIDVENTQNKIEFNIKKGKHNGK